LVPSRKNVFTAVKRAIVIGLIAFFLAIAIGLGSQSLLESISTTAIAFSLLIIIILIGIAFDIVGTAVTAASETPFHAKAACKVSGAKHAILLIKNADKVANFCNDVVGDVSASLSGAIGATIISNLIINYTENAMVLGSTIMTGFIAAITVGGKALGKNMAITQSNEIIFQVGKVFYWLEYKLNITFLKAPRRKGRKNAQN
jgi:Mg2+/Co2+ transporter CorB